MKDSIFVYGRQHFIKADPAVQVEWVYKNDHLLGIFNINDLRELIHCDLPDGTYLDLISNQEVSVKNNQLTMDQIPALILKLSPEITLKKMKSEWLGLI